VPLGECAYAALPLDCHSEQLDDVAILENTRVPSEITVCQQLSTRPVFCVESRHQRPQSSSASRFTADFLTFTERVGPATLSPRKLGIFRAVNELKAAPGLGRIIRRSHDPMADHHLAASGSLLGTSEERGRSLRKRHQRREGPRRNQEVLATLRLCGSRLYGQVRDP
jgi:hypothetical protein